MTFSFLKKHPLAPWISLLFLVSFIWSTTFIIIKEVLVELSPANYLFSRFSLACIILFLIYWKDIKHFWQLFSRKGLILGAILSICYFAGAYGVEYTTASNATFIGSMFIIFVPLLEWLILKKKISRRVLMATIIAAIGILFLTGAVTLSFQLGDGLVLISALAMAFHILLTERFAKDIPTKTLMVSQMFVVTIIAGIVALFQGGIALPSTMETFYPILYLALFATVFAFEVITYAEKHVESTDTCLILSFQGIFAFVLAVMLHLEIPTPYKIIGVVLLTFANILAESKKKGICH